MTLNTPFRGPLSGGPLLTASPVSAVYDNHLQRTALRALRAGHQTHAAVARATALPQNATDRALSLLQCNGRIVYDWDRVILLH